MVVSVLTSQRKNATVAAKSVILRRGFLLLMGIYVIFFCISLRLYYWQIVQESTLEAAAESQYERVVTYSGQRGNIYTSDNYLLVSNRKVYRVFAHPHLVTENAHETSSKLAELLVIELTTFTEASSAAEQAVVKQNLEQELRDKLTRPNTKWISLHPAISETTKLAIQALKYPFIGFDTLYRRDYPEASMAAHLTGFVGKDSEGADVGYFGLEGALENELKARSSTSRIIADATGLQLSGTTPLSPDLLNGRDVVTTIRRDIQHLIERELYQGMQRYGAKKGEIIVMEPKTGKILGMAAYPNYEQDKFFTYPAETYRNPSLSELYEPGSTLKTLTVAAGIDAGVISATTQCPKCGSARVFGRYTIKTWNDTYNPNITMEEALAKSDNTAMIYIAELLGADRFQTYLKNFGIGEPLRIDLQGDLSTPFPTKWGPVELATTSFGQGITTTSLQLVRAIAAIANQGKLMRPLIVERVTDPSSGEVIVNHPTQERQVISKESAETVSSMMVTAAQRGEAQWTASKTHTIAGKTGTSQIAESGSYASDRTIASFIGFAPAHDPAYIMLVKFTEPQSSPWAAETAAPLWYTIAEKLHLLLAVPPDRTQGSDS